MDGHLQEILYAIGSVAATVSIIVGIIRNMFKDMEMRIDKRFEQIDKRFEQIDKKFEQIDKRFEEINNVLQQINQNHIDHLMALHAVPAMPVSDRQTKSE